MTCMPILRCGLVALSLFTILPGPAWAQSTPLDVIPADSLIAFAVRDLDSLTKKGDALLKEIDLSIQRPSQLAELAANFLGVSSFLDRSGTLAVAFVKTSGQADTQPRNLLGECLVVIVPFKDRKKVLEHYELKEDDIKEGKTTKVTKGNGVFALGQLALKGKHLYLAENSKGIELAMKSPTLGSALTEQQRKLFGQSDVLVQLGAQQWGETWKKWIGKIGEAVGESKDESERESVELLKKALGQVRFGLAGLEVDNGLKFHLTAVFPKEGA